MMYAVVVRSSTQAVEEQKKLEATLSVEVDGARVRISEIQTEMESVIEQLGEAKVSQYLSRTVPLTNSAYWKLIAVVQCIS